MRLLHTLAIIATLVVVTQSARTPVAFRLDDIQCGWMEENAQAIINKFIQYNVPITLAIITGLGDCYSAWLSPLLAAHPNLIEIASHTVSHIDLRNMTDEQLTSEISSSRTKLQSLFPSAPVNLFVPPGNAWNDTILEYIASAGYASWSSQCTRQAVSNFGVVTGMDYACITSMYQDVAYPFFQQFDGLYNIPIGVATADFYNGTLVAPQALVQAPVADCYSPGPCSILSQLDANSNRMMAGLVPFAAVMMHPVEWPNVATIQTYFDTLLPLVTANYDVYTVSGLLIGTNQTLANQLSSTGSAVSSSSSSTGTVSSSSSSTGTTISSSSTGVASSSSTGRASSSSTGRASSSTGTTRSSSTGLNILPSSSTGIHKSSSSSTGLSDASAAPPVAAGNYFIQFVGAIFAFLFTAWMA